MSHFTLQNIPPECFSRKLSAQCFVAEIYPYGNAYGKQVNFTCRCIQLYMLDPTLYESC